MNYIIFKLIGILLLIMAMIYTRVKKPTPVAWLILIPCLLFIFIGAVIQTGILPLFGEMLHVQGNQYSIIPERAFFGLIITVLSFVLLVITCEFNKSDKTKKDEKEQS
jgi:carbon starvation protein CstA